ncbi:MAG: DUF4230 domain-containing protein [Butyrivibrio sp.]|nr:DUF4230 domain-containing protein [Muribaculum sp.]MCM1552986.1 DUF4230 domain-containing protein [Butyrivibrio sp.]
MKRMILAWILVLILGSCTACARTDDPSGNVDFEPQSSRMKAICEMATMDCYYHVVAKYFEEDAEGFWLWKKDKRFWVEYSGVVTIGIDAARLEIEVEDTDVTISIPPAVILDIAVDERSLTEDSYYVERDSAAITAQDQTKAFEEAQENMRDKAASDTALLQSAQQRAQSLLEDYVNNIGEAVGKKYHINWIYLE